MSRLIDADELKEYIDTQSGRPFIGCTVGDAMKIMIDEQPTVEERKMGRWLRENMARNNETYPVIRCSECGWCYPQSLLFETKYCPVCGARMEE